MSGPIAVDSRVRSLARLVTGSEGHRQIILHERQSGVVPMLKIGCKPGNRITAASLVEEDSDPSLAKFKSQALTDVEIHSIHLCRVT
jgi:hypothetical protein